MPVMPLNNREVRQKIRSANKAFGKCFHLAFCFFRAIVSRQRPGRLRKEVIQPHLPVQLPCYDFVPITSPAFSSSLRKVSFPISGVTSSHDVTGGVYKARERIHRNVLICGY
jgi:hypothetical protein